MKGLLSARTFASASNLHIALHFVYEAAEDSTVLVPSA